MLGCALVGSAGLRPTAVLAALADEMPLVHLHSGLGPIDHAVLFQIRLPRIALGALVGALLATTGAGYQGVFRNPLIDSGMLGASAGAGLGATLAIVYLGGSGAAVPIAAFVGAVAGVATAYFVGSVGASTPSLLLGGVAVGMFLVALQTYVMQRSTQDLQAVYSWLLGSLSGATWRQFLIALPYAAASTVVLLLHARHLDVLSVGDEEAASLGMRPQRVRLLVVAACALATATAVAVSGLIGFVGIVVPHVVRRLGGVSHASVLPLSLFVGAGFLTVADTIARTAISPGELPIGVITALIGCPVFVWILRVTPDVGP
jgi:iron complex transport system permease protein